jgi:hypothetical protein
MCICFLKIQVKQRKYCFYCFKISTINGCYASCITSCIKLTKTVHEDLNGSYEGVSKSFRIGRLERELQMVQLSALEAVVSLFCESV